MSGADLTNAEQPDSITDSIASGSTAQGGRDNFTFAGKLTGLALTGGPADVFINGEQIDPAQYRTSTPTPTATPTPTSKPSDELEPTLDPEAIATHHTHGLQNAESSLSTTPQPCAIPQLTAQKPVVKTHESIFL